MHNSGKIAKAAALSSFILLMTGFVAWRSGLLDKYLYSANGGNSLSNYPYENTSIPDTGRNPVDSNRNRQMMSGSKSLILSDVSPERSSSLPNNGRLTIFVADSVWKKYEEESFKERLYMGSSKSGPVIRPNHPGRKRYPLSVNGNLDFYTSPQIDSLLMLNPIIDSLQPTKVQKPDTALFNPPRAPSSKSGSVFYPSDLKKKNKKKNQ